MEREPRNFQINKAAVDFPKKSDAKYWSVARIGEASSVAKSQIKGRFHRSLPSAAS